MTIHREGRTILFSLLLILVGINYAVDQLGGSELLQNWVMGGSIILYILVLQFFRDPTVETPEDEQAVYAPADGKVVVIEKTEEAEYLGETRTQVSIFMSPLNVHVNRSPVAGQVSYFKYHPGKYLVAWHPKSSTENERTTLAIRTKQNVEILLRQVAGAMARRIKCYVSRGTQLNQGQEFGFIRFGSRVDVYLPESYEITVEVGDKTRAGKTVIARQS